MARQQSLGGSVGQRSTTVLLYVALLLCEFSEAFPFENPQDDNATSAQSRVTPPRRVHACEFGFHPPYLRSCQNKNDLFSDPRGRVLHKLSTIDLVKSPNEQRWTEATAEGDASRITLSKRRTEIFVTRIEASNKREK